LVGRWGWWRVVVIVVIVIMRRLGRLLHSSGLLYWLHHRGVASGHGKQGDGGKKNCCKRRASCHGLASGNASAQKMRSPA